MSNRWLMAFFCGCAFPLLAQEAEVEAVEEKPYASLIDNSPFLTPSFKARLGQHDSTTLSFIGYTRVGGIWHFALIDQKSGQTHWLKMNEEVDGLKIESFDEQNKQVHMTVGGIGFDLTLLEAKTGSTLIQNQAAAGAPTKAGHQNRSSQQARAMDTKTAALKKSAPYRKSAQGKTAQARSKKTPLKKKK